MSRLLVPHSCPKSIQVKHLHRRQKGATRSVVQATKKSWLESEAGRVWKAERNKLLRADSDDDDSDSDDDDSG